MKVELVISNVSNVMTPGHCANNSNGVCGINVRQI